MRFAVFIPTTLVSICAACIAYGGAWTQPQGQGQLIITGLYNAADKFYNTTGQKQSQPTYRKFELNPYMEYGVTDWATVGANLSLQHASQSTQTNWGMGDSEFFARFRVAQVSGLVISLQPLLKLPSLEHYGESPALGGRNPDAEMGASFGYGFDLFGQHHFANLDTGYRYRFGDPKDQLKLAATVGIALTPQWMVMPQAFFTHRMDAPTGAGFTQSSGDDYSESKLQLSVVYKVNPNWSLQAGAFTELKGKNIGDGDGVILSVWRSF